MTETILRFESRQLKPYSEPLPAGALRVGAVYFSVGFVDDMVVPIVETLVYLGRDLAPGDAGQLWFQDVESYRGGVRYPGHDDHKGAAKFIRTPETDGGRVFDYEHALNELLRCSLLRRERGIE